jgi:enhancing lycopene biosynthesis protein 2
VLRVGILLAGCGAHDGSDPFEVAFTALALDRHGLRAAYLVPPGLQPEVVDHLSGMRDEAAPPRRLDAESARLARGPVLPFVEAEVTGLGALIVPGGAGVVKCLMRGALVPGLRAELDDAVRHPLAAFRARGAPLGAIGLGIEVLARIEPGATFDALATPPRTAGVDEARRLAWAPGFLGTDRPADAAAGIDEMVKALARMLGRPAALPR